MFAFMPKNWHNGIHLEVMSINNNFGRERLETEINGFHSETILVTFAKCRQLADSTRDIHPEALNIDNNFDRKGCRTQLTQK